MNGRFRDRAIVFLIIWVKVVPFQERTNNSYGKGTCVQGCVDDVSNGTKQVWRAVREERGRNGVKFTDIGFKVFDTSISETG